MLIEICFQRLRQFFITVKFSREQATIHRRHLSIPWQGFGKRMPRLLHLFQRLMPLFWISWITFTLSLAAVFGSHRYFIFSEWPNAWQCLSESRGGSCLMQSIFSITALRYCQVLNLRLCRSRDQVLQRAYCGAVLWSQCCTVLSNSFKLWNCF